MKNEDTTKPNAEEEAAKTAADASATADPAKQQAADADPNKTAAAEGGEELTDEQKVAAITQDFEGLVEKHTETAGELKTAQERITELEAENEQLKTAAADGGQKSAEAQEALESQGIKVAELLIGRGLVQAGVDKEILGRKLAADHSGAIDVIEKVANQVQAHQMGAPEEGDQHKVAADSGPRDPILAGLGIDAPLDG